MTERLLAVLLQQALLLSVGVVLLAALRPPVLKRLGAGATYAAWLLLPALLMTPQLPRPAQEPLQVVMQAIKQETLEMPALPAPPASQAVIWLMVWLAGSATVALAQSARQWRLTRLGSQLPAGSSPALIGLLRPRVALPVDFEQRFSPVERELILAHEQVHRARGDNAWNLLACALTVLHWWNPLAWWAARRMQADQELACDAAVLASRPQARADYTRALLAAHDLTPHVAPLASRWGSSHPLIERIAMLNRPRPLTRRHALLMATGMAGLSTLAYAAGNLTPPGASYIQVQLMVERTEGIERPQHRTTLEAKVVSRDRERVELRLSAISSDRKSWATEPLRIGLLAEKHDGAALIKTEILSGDAGVEIAHPSVMAAWGTKARVEITRHESDERLVLELTPTALPADYQPPKRDF